MIMRSVSDVGVSILLILGLVCVLIGRHRIAPCQVVYQRLRDIGSGQEPVPPVRTDDDPRPPSDVVPVSITPAVPISGSGMASSPFDLAQASVGDDFLSFVTHILPGSAAATTTPTSSLLHLLRHHTRQFWGDEDPYSELIDAGVAPYDNCHERGGRRITWFVLRGHLRSFGMKLANFKSFVEAADCAVVLLYTMDAVEADGKAWWSGDRAKEAGGPSENTADENFGVAGAVPPAEFEGTSRYFHGQLVHRARASATTSSVGRTLEGILASDEGSFLSKNFAWVVERRKIDSPLPMEVLGWPLLMEVVRKHVYKIDLAQQSSSASSPPSSSEKSQSSNTAAQTTAPQPIPHLLVVTRPDLLYSHSFDFDRLFALERSAFSQKKGFGILMPHDAGKINEWDPSELLVIGNRFYLLRMVLRWSAGFAPLRQYNAREAARFYHPLSPFSGERWFACCVNQEKSVVPLEQMKIRGEGGGPPSPSGTSSVPSPDEELPRGSSSSGGGTEDSGAVDREDLRAEGAGAGKGSSEGGGARRLSEDSVVPEHAVPAAYHGARRGVTVACGTGFSRLWMNSAFEESDLFFLRPEFKVHLLRVSGVYTAALNRPGNTKLFSDNLNLKKVKAGVGVHVHAAIPAARQNFDITRGGWSVVGGKNCREPGKIQRAGFEKVLNDGVTGKRKAGTTQNPIAYAFHELLHNGYLYRSKVQLDDFLAVVESPEHPAPQE